MEWINVEHELPESGHYVLAVCRIDFCGKMSASHVTEAMFCRNSGWKIPNLEKLKIVVYYWADLPEVPELQCE